MKKLSKITAVFFVATFIFLSTSCKPEAEYHEKIIIVEKQVDKEKTTDSENSIDKDESAEVNETIPDGFVKVKGVEINGTETWIPESNLFKKDEKFSIPDLIACDHEVTRGEYIKIIGTDPSAQYSKYNYYYDKDENTISRENAINNPITHVLWYDTFVYCNKLSVKENLKPCYSINGSTDTDAWGDVPHENNETWNAVSCDFEANGYRLPTIAEWEWLARGGENYTYSGSDDITEVAWYYYNTQGTHDVKTKKANAYGIYDMSGNVSEWCWDTFKIGDETRHYCCGGSIWDESKDCKVIVNPYWDTVLPATFTSSIGFRIVRSCSK